MEQPRLNAIVAALCVAAGAAAVGGVGDTAGVSVWWALAACVAAAPAVLLLNRHLDEEAHREGYPPRRAGAQWFWLAVVELAGTWVAYAWWRGLYERVGASPDWHQNTWAVLLVGAAVAMVASVAFARPPLPELGAPSMPVLRPAVADPQFASWERRLAEAGSVKGCQVLGITAWPVQPDQDRSYGYTVTARLPGGGATLGDLQYKSEQIASDLDLADGCGVEVLGDGSRRAFVVEVSVLDALAQERFYPDDLSVTSINDPVQYGIHRRGDVASGDLRQATAVVAGQTGSGKSNTLNVLHTGIARTDDAILLVIDIPKRGKLARPLIDPWVNGQASRPIVDWVAHTPEEALLMTDFALEVIGERSVKYYDLQVEHDDDKLPVSHEVPEIIIVIDEAAEVMGLDVKDKTLQQVSANLCEIARTGRDAAVRTVICTIRATSDFIPAEMKKHANLRIGMRVVDDEEVRYLFGWEANLDIADAPHPGCGFERSNQDAVRPFRSWRMRPSTLGRVAVACADRRPDMDAVSLGVPSADKYLTRWRRVLPDIYGDERAAEVLARGPYERGYRRPAAPPPALPPTPPPPPAEVDTGHDVSTYGVHLPARPGVHLTTPQVSGPVSTSRGGHLRLVPDLPDVVAHPPAAVAGRAARRAAADEHGLDDADYGLGDEADMEEFERLIAAGEEAAASDAEEFGLAPAALALPPADEEVEAKRRARERVMELLRAAGRSGASVAQLRDALDREGTQVPERTVYSWLKASAHDGGYRNWVHPEHVPGGGR